jgi:hypothetical protein
LRRRRSRPRIAGMSVNAGRSVIRRARPTRRRPWLRLRSARLDE